MVSPITSCLTVVPSLRQGSGKPFVVELGPGPVYPQDTIPRTMGRRSGRIRLWRRPYVAWPPATPPPGACTFRGSNTHSTPWWARPPAYPLSSAPLVTSHPFFPSRKMEAAVPSVQAHLRRCQRVWKAARDSMLQSRDRVQRVANRRRVPAPAYRPGQRVWLLAKDLPLPAVSRKLAPRYIGPYTILKVINPSALCLQLPYSLKVHPVFHLSQVKPVADCDLSQH